MDATVNIDKLQLLNDRIHQAIDALNQVRTSVRGLAHSGSADPWTGAPQPFMRSPYAQEYGVPMTSVPVSGIQHMSPVPVGFGPVLSDPRTLDLRLLDPRLQAGFVSGLVHSTPKLIEEQIANASVSDPRKLAQTFPYLMSDRPIVQKI